MSLMGYLATVISFGLGEWMLLFTLMLALLFLSYFQEELYMSAVAAICALNLFLIAIWHYPTTQIYMGTLITIIYVPVIVMHQHLMRCRKPIFWSALMSGISLLGFIIG